MKQTVGNSKGKRDGGMLLIRGQSPLEYGDIINLYGNCLTKLVLSVFFAREFEFQFCGWC